MAWWQTLFGKKPNHEAIKPDAPKENRGFTMISDPAKIDVAAAKARILGSREISKPTGSYFQDQQTIAQWQFVLEHEPENINAYLSIGEILLHYKQKRKAQKCFEKVLEIDPYNERAKSRLSAQG